MASVAFSDKYFASLMKLTPKEQSQANKAVMLFQQDPQHAGLHYEKLTVFKDNKLRSIRANQDVRIILASADNEDLYLMLYVDHHDDAYNWASKKKIEINPNTGSLQVFTVEDGVEEEKRKENGTQHSSGLFDSIRDRQLLQLGVPEEAIDLVRGIETEENLEAAKINEQIPVDSYEGLFLLMAGASFEEAYNEVVPVAPTKVDIADFTAALSRPETQAHFAVAEDEEALKDVLNQSIEKWRVFLHPAQRRLAVGKKTGAVRVLGGAGTGKTVVAMHRAKWLAENVATGSSRILFTTFTRNLATDIQQNLNKICTQDELESIEVVNLDAWVMGFLKKRGYDYGLLMDSRQESDLWTQAYSDKPAGIDLSMPFFQEEWARVVQPQSISSVDEYKKASRIGRGTRLNRKQRLEIWPVFERFRHLLASNHLKEADDAYRDARELLEANPAIRPDICSIVVDEAQDMGTQAFLLLRTMVPKGPNDLFIVGDGHQRIYGKNKVVLGQCGIDIRGRSARLKVNYRTTDETRKLAVRILENVKVDDLDGGVDTHRFYHSLIHGPEPVIRCFESADQQAEAVLGAIKEHAFNPEACCVIARTRKELMSIRAALESRNQVCHTLDARSAKTPEGALNFATMHRVKGVEFDAVFLASANKGLIPLDFVINSGADAVTRRQLEDEERALVYVSLTRARKMAYIFAVGEMSPCFPG